MRSRYFVLVSIAGVVALNSCGEKSATTTGTPTLTVTPDSAIYSAAVVGTTSAATTFTVTNTGDGVSGAVNADFVGTNAADFQATGACLGSSLAPTETCQVKVAFAPQAAGARTAGLSISASPGGTSTNLLKGTGTAATATLTLTPATNDFAQVAVGSTSAAVTFTATNTGAAASGALTAAFSGANAADFLATGSCLGSPLAVAATCAIAVKFSPQAIGSRLANLTVSGAPGGTVASALTGTGTAAPSPTLAITPATNAFASRTVGTTSTATPFTVTNTGATTSGALSATVTGPNAADFVATSSCLGSPLAQAATCIVNVTFSPGADGARVASLSVTGAPGGTVTSSLTGTGAGAAHLSIASASAGVFAITNTGGSVSGTMALTSSASAGQAGTLTPNGDTCSGQTLAAGATCSLNLSVVPLEGGIVVMNFTVTASPGGSVVGSVASLVTSPNLTTSATTLTFASQPVGVTAANSETQSVTVTNTGGYVSSAITAGLSGANAADYSVTGGTCISNTLAPADTCTVNLRFIPSGVSGGRTGTLTLLASSGFPGGQKSVAATGPATSALTITPTTSPFTFDHGPVLANGGSSIGQVLTVTNSPLVGSSGQLLTQLLGGNATEFTLSSNNCLGVSLAASATCTITTSFAPLALGARSTTLNVGSGTSPGPVFTLSGTGATPPAITPSVTSINFASRSAGTTSPATLLTLTNNGGVASGPISVTISGANSAEFSFSLGTCAGPGLAPGATCDLNVFFGPIIAGTKTATITFGSGTATVSLSGVGS